MRIKRRIEWLLPAGILVLASCRAAPRPAEPPTDQPEPLALPFPAAPGGGIIIQKNVMVPMRDGIRLATDIYRPSGPGQYPVVLIRTPYGSESPESARQGQYYVTRGYGYAIQDVRGKYDSEGDWNGRRNEAEDGSDAITWLGTRPWSNGKVGMTGPSYLGIVQYWVSDQQNPYLKALVPQVAPATLGRDTADYDHLATASSRETGPLNFVWMLGVDGRVNQADGQRDLSGLAWLEARDHLPRVDYPRVFGRPMIWWPFLLDQRYGFWEEYFLRASLGEWSKPVGAAAWFAGYQARYRKVNVPMLHVSGWYDCCGEPMLENFKLIRKYAVDPVARDNQKLLMGPWFHGWGPRKVGAFDFGAQAAIKPDSLAIRWFDHWLKGEDNGVDREPPVRVFVMGENRWREATDWPIPGTQFTKFYLHSKGDARLEKGGGSLSISTPGEELADRYTYDPGNPTPELLDSNKVWVVGPADRTSVEKRPDVLVYTSDPIREPLEVTGPLTAVLYLATSAPSTDLFVNLLDVHPDGAGYNLFNTFTAPYRTHWAKEVENGPNGIRIIKAEISLYPTANVFLPGHRIRVEISSAAAPSVRGLNVEGGTEPSATKWNVAEQTIYHDRTHPSHVVLPVIPRSSEVASSITGASKERP